MNTLNEAKEDLANMTRSFYTQLTEFQNKYEDLNVNELSMDTMKNIGSDQAIILNVKIHVSLA